MLAEGLIAKKPKARGLSFNVMQVIFAKKLCVLKRLGAIPVVLLVTTHSLNYAIIAI